MATTIKLKNSVTTTNAPSSLAQGEVAINVTDKKVWVGNAATTPVQLLGTGSDGSFTNLTVSGTTALNGGTTLGDASGDALTINSSAVSIPNGLNFGSNNLVLSSGNVGVGTSSPAAKVHLLTAAATPVALRCGNTQSYAEFQVDGSGNSQLIAPNGVQIFNTNGAERMRIDSSGKVGIGISSPSYGLSVNSSTGINSYNGVSGLGKFVLGDPTDNNGYVGMYRGNAGDPNTAGNDLSLGSVSIITFRTGAASFASQTERMRIDSSGNLLVGTTSFANASGGARVQSSGQLNISSTTTASTQIAGWFNGNGQVGNITISGTATSYNTSSDYRLKENIAPMTGALATVSALKPVTYKWKSDGSDGQGFIAHELQEVVPDCVTGEKDAVDAEGKPQYQGIDTSFLVATLAASIQELKAIVDAQAARIAVLESK